MPPILYIKNALRIAGEGLGDGTAYLTATSAVPDQANLTITLSGKTLIPDIGPDADDKFNGYILHFVLSGMDFHIIDWVASTSTATVNEVPSLINVGACEIRRAIVDSPFSSSNLVFKSANGHRFPNYTPPVSPTIDVYLPNHINNGGFETGALSPWVKTATGGTSDTTSVNSTAPILGARDLKINKGDRASLFVSQPLAEKLDKNKKYRLLFKAKHTTGTFNPGDFSVQFADTTGIRRAELPQFKTPSSGVIGTNNWEPLLTTTSTWHWADVVMGKSDVTGDFCNLSFEIKTSIVDFNLDEVYLFDAVNVSALIMFDHNTLATYDISGSRCAQDRSSFVAGVDSASFGTGLVDVSSPSKIEFSGGIFPVYRIQNASGLIKASEIFLCEKWAWLHGPNRPVSFEDEEYNESSFEARGGAIETTRDNSKLEFKDTYTSMPESERLVLVQDWKPYHRDDLYSFSVSIESGDAPVLMIDRSKKFSNPYSSINPDWSFNFEEVK